MHYGDDGVPYRVDDYGVVWFGCSMVPVKEERGDD